MSSAASPSEFLTFYRRLATSSAICRSASPRALATRPFHVSAAARVGDHMDDKTHATRKDDTLDIQSSSVKAGQESRSKDTGGSATREKDEAGGAAKAKKDFPEAPDTAIGMQDERGAKP